LVEAGDIDDIQDDYQALSELYDLVSEEPMTETMEEYLGMIREAMDMAEGRVTRDEMESDWDGIRKDALIEYTESGKRPPYRAEWPEWVPIDWDDSWEDWRADGGY
tara:strand:- start:35 stop:352 length:318 start_codon:yes stop_codon:yes gene_type:complete